MANDNVVRPAFGNNVVRPAFGKKKPDAEAPKVGPTPLESISQEVSDDYKHIGPLTGEALSRAQQDLVYMLANSDYVHGVRNKLEEAGDVIFGLKGFSTNDNNIKLRRQSLKSASLEDICKQAENTHQLKWRSQPSYLGALTLEYHYRVQIALSLMSGEDSSPG